MQLVDPILQAGAGNQREHGEFRRPHAACLLLHFVWTCWYHFSPLAGWKFSNKIYKYLFDLFCLLAFMILVVWDFLQHKTITFEWKTLDRRSKAAVPT